MKECYLNGDYVDLADAKVSVLDRASFGEGIYEVIGVHSRKPFIIPSSERLDLNLSEMGLSNPLSFEAWSSLILILSRVTAVYSGVFTFKLREVKHLATMNFQRQAVLLFLL